MTTDFRGNGYSKNRLIRICAGESTLTITTLITLDIIERFSIVSKVISELLWFCITSLSDWFKVLAPLFNQ